MMKWLRNLITTDRSDRRLRNARALLRSDPFLKQTGITEEVLAAAFEEKERMRREDPELDRLYRELERCNDWDEGRRLEREIKQRKLARQFAEPSGGELVDEEDEVEEEDEDEGDEDEQLPLHRCDEAMTPEASVIHVFGNEEDEDGRRRCRRCNLMLKPKRIDTILDDFVYDMLEDIVDDEADDDGRSDNNNTAQTLSGEEHAEPMQRSGFSIEELRELADMLREAKDEPEPINEPLIEQLAREGRPLEEGLMEGQYRCDVFATRLAKSEIDDRWVYVLHNFGDGRPSCSWCGMAAANIEDLRLPFELRGPFTFADEPKVEG